ncbi:MAG TPA: hypothetical protein VFQ61_11155 [Polyangiaceae bacterium]|nr:hypothetical protein [Polyangiaceae bacterium]
MDRHTAGPGKGGDALDPLAPFRRAMEALCDDGFPKAAVQKIVAELAFGSQVGRGGAAVPQRDALDIYRNARSRLEQGGDGKPKSGRAVARASGVQVSRRER